MSCKTNFTSKMLLGLAIFSLLIIAPTTASAIEYRLADFMILVDDQLIIKGAADVISFQGGIFQNKQMRSDLGSRNFAQIGGRLSCRIPVDAPTVADVAIIAPNVTLGNFAKVSHVIYDAATGSFNDIGTSGRLGPTLLENDLGNNSLNDTGFKNLPDFPAFPVFAPGAADVIVPSGGVTSITPGNYRDLIVGHKGTVNFASGIYNFRRIIINVAGEYNLIFEDDTEIRVKQFVRLAEYGNVNPTSANNVIMYVEGEDGDYGGANRNQDGVYGLPAAFEYDGDGNFSLCFVFVPNGTMNIRGHSQPPYATQWLGKSFQQISSLRIILQQAIESCIPPGIDCACITDFTRRSDGTLQVRGINLSEDTVGKLAIFTETAVAGIGGLTGGDAGADQAATDLTFIPTDRFNTDNNVVAALAAGHTSGDKFFLGIIYPEVPDPVTGFPFVPGYCILTGKLLELP
ncbi:MAG: hypothetical protein C4530_17215 [Desulfobacteraceae bacterium]|nr:MAG: hypothetical protein C4530_17215 [Desulfobacteraceae bacterium]